MTENVTNEPAKTNCPVSACANLTVERKVQVVGGALFLIQAFLALAISPLFVWLIAISAGLMIYGAISGNCQLEKLVRKHCPVERSKTA